MTRPLRVVVADDEPLARREAPDLLFLDVQMPELDGFGVLRALPPARMPATVFVTAFDQYALRAFEAHALDYLLKPFTETRFRAAFERARALVNRPQPGEQSAILALLERVRMEQQELRSMVEGADRWLERVLIRVGGRVRVVPVEEIDYIEAARNNVRIHVGKDVHLLRESLSALETRLDPARFGRIHRSTIVNLGRVAEIEPWFSGDCVVVLRLGVRLRLSRGHRQEFEARLGIGRPRRSAARGGGSR